MYQIKNILSLENIRNRLAALADKSTIDSVTKQMHDEVAALDWAIKTIKESELVDVILVIGNREFMESAQIGDLVVVLGDDLALAVFDSNEKKRKDLFDVFVPNVSIPDEWPGTPLQQQMVPSFALGKRYFASGNEERKQRAILVELSILRGIEQTKLHNWLVDFYRAIRWDDAKPVKKGRKDV